MNCYLCNEEIGYDSGDICEYCEDAKFSKLVDDYEYYQTQVGLSDNYKRELTFTEYLKKIKG